MTSSREIQIEYPVDLLNAGSEIYLQSSGSLCANIGAIQPSTANYLS